MCIVMEVKNSSLWQCLFILPLINIFVFESLLLVISR